MTHVAPSPIRGVRHGELVYHDLPDLAHLEAVTTQLMTEAEKQQEREAAKQRVLKGFIEAVTEKGYLVPRDLNLYGGVVNISEAPPNLTDGD